MFVFIFVFVKKLKPFCRQLVKNATTANGSATEAWGGEELWLYFAIGGDVFVLLNCICVLFVFQNCRYLV